MAFLKPESAETKASTRRPSKRPRWQVGSCTKHLPATFPFACWALFVEQQRSSKPSRRARLCRATLFRNRSSNAYPEVGLNYCAKASASSSMWLRAGGLESPWPADQEACQSSRFCFHPEGTLVSRTGNSKIPLVYFY